MLAKQNLKELSTWTGFVGIMTIIFGALSALSGLSVFIIGAIPGIIMIYVGVKLRNAKKMADELIALPEGTDESGKLNALIINLNSYFKVQGVLFIVALVMMVVGILISLILGVSLMNSMNF